jgi:hypothetical protein
MVLVDTLSCDTIPLRSSPCREENNWGYVIRCHVDWHYADHTNWFSNAFLMMQWVRHETPHPWQDQELVSQQVLYYFYVSPSEFSRGLNILPYRVPQYSSSLTWLHITFNNKTTDPKMDSLMSLIFSFAELVCTVKYHFWNPIDNQ